MKGERLGEFEEFTLLAVRALGDTPYAVPIQQYVEKVTARPISMGSIYAALTRLEEKGFLRSAMSEVDRAARRQIQARLLGHAERAEGGAGSSTVSANASGMRSPKADDRDAGGSPACHRPLAVAR